jgi:hypothetical protein
MNIVTKRQKHKWNYSHVDFSFLFLHVYLNFVLKITDIRHMWTHTFIFEFFWNLEI